MDIMKYDCGQGDLKNWLITENKFDVRYLGKCEAIFAQGNGYLGVRHALEESYVGEVRNMFVTGTFNKASEDEVTELPNLPDVTGAVIYVDGHRLDLVSGGLKEYSRTMNLKTGEVVRRFTWSSQTDVILDCTFRRIVSLADEHVVAASFDITPVNKDAVIVIDTGINGEMTNSGAQHFREAKRRIYDSVYMQFLTKTTESEVSMVLHSACKISDSKAAVLPIMNRRTLSNKYTSNTAAGSTLHFEKISTIHTSRDLKYDGKDIDDFTEVLKADGMEALKKNFEKGYDKLLEESAKAWEKYWNTSDIKIQAACKEAEYDQLAVRFALYHLNIMVKDDDNRVGIGAKALTGEGYKGHSFWDTEMFILPYFTFTKPNAARTLLEYRYKNLYGAHLKAKEAGYEGAMYPWECAWIDDGEVTPLYIGADVVTGKIMKVLTGLIEHHISADIAYAVWQYYMVSGDQDYMNLYGYEIIIDTALFWASRLEYNKELDRYEINDVIGPDEYKEHVNNNAYTNYMAAFNMNLALKIMEELEEKDAELYEKLNKKLDFAHIRELITGRIGKLYLPKPNEDGIIPQSDQYLKLKKMDLTKYKESKEVLTIYNDYNMEQLNEYMVSKQADTVMLLFLLDDLFDMETKKKNFLFYEDKTLHDSSLSRSTHTILANDFGMHEMAYHLFKGALDIDLGPQMKSSNAGIHSASTGGIWECVVMGYGGVRVVGTDLRIAPRLPEAWNECAFPIVWRGNRLAVTVTGNQVIVKNEGASAVELILADEKVTIPAGMSQKKEL